MADIVLRNLDASLKDGLRQRAAKNGRSMNAELLAIVRDALARPSSAPRADVEALAADIRRLSAGRVQTPSEQLLREDRDQR